MNCELSSKDVFVAYCCFPCLASLDKESTSMNRNFIAQLIDNVLLLQVNQILAYRTEILNHLFYTCRLLTILRSKNIQQCWNTNIERLRKSLGCVTSLLTKIRSFITILHIV
ncbi:hypothetical protein E2986_12080 [Frieseomelitta varia]|uniref:Uncharacterized protein n=1 Tax=Frieseomelitta varia TaxID=561572 RepID=A0A833RMG1_9HYME|nr:hypothetical protein E2986_12080 [Frieseomelitta varia]